MKTFFGRKLMGALLAVVVLGVAVPAMAKAPKMEEQVLSDLSSTNAKVVYGALQVLEKSFPTSAPGLAKAKSLVTDERATVREKAARVLGALHAEVSEADLRNIAKLLDGTGKDEITEGLKALRGLKAESTIPKILPLLKNPDPFVKRDALRTLSVLGDKSIVPQIQPLTQDADPRVVKDANDAIFNLNSK
jgi:HEAT repeat protein